jgi:SAM-dependent methyltransferase
MSRVQRFFDGLAGKRNARPSTPLREALPYPVQVRRRVYADERVGKRGGLQVFDSPQALALNEARMAHLESLGLELAGKRVLDVGAGVGHLAARLQKMGCSVLCVEGRPGNVESMRARYPKLEGEVGNVETEPLSRFGDFDVVFSYGLLYHLENPLHSIRNMASVCKQLLLLESMVCDHELPIIRNEDESADVNQALAGLACRPSPHYVVLALNRAGFPHVYAPLTPPEHEDFRFEWKNNLDCSRDGHPLRCVFVAARTELRNPHLVPLLRD